MSKSTCLNADVGELPGDEGRALDRAILDVVTRCSIACGGHAGDDESMTATMRAADARGVLIGAHPSYPDRAGFGRSRINISDADLELSLLSQVRRLKAIGRERGVPLVHLKPHGSLYNDAARDRALADMVATVCVRTDIDTLIGPPSSELTAAAEATGLTFIAEAFADRAYEADGSLTPRSMPGAVITDAAGQLAQVLSLVQSGRVTARTGEAVYLVAQTICLHGDTPGAARSAFHLKQALLDRGLSIEA
ncbi:5-oxoprolinase subunit PxpA [uncultured Hyphomonas sp.]|uniref:5-oxoprolinase subunit PxpA n=1 Tax=uncultured Hyphomonas sp. TaxID=225298 RepID=UPI002AAB10A4|nr:5-oxoprolinase subunit PxpA [uncultured Hyphomonas sp.]